MSKFLKSISAFPLACLAVIGVPVVLSACSTQQVQQFATVACTADPLVLAGAKTAETVAVIADPKTAVAVAALNAADAVVHPAVVAACSAAQSGSVPVAGTVSAVSVPVAAPVSQTTAVILPLTAIQTPVTTP